MEIVLDVAISFTSSIKLESTALSLDMLSFRNSMSSTMSFSGRHNVEKPSKLFFDSNQISTIGAHFAGWGIVSKPFLLLQRATRL